MHDFGNTAQTKNNNPNDAIHLDHAKGVWIDHNDLSMAGDKADRGQQRLDGDHRDVEPPARSGAGVPGRQPGHRRRRHRAGRHRGPTTSSITPATATPVVSFGRAHVYNNYYVDWKIYAVRSERAAQLYLQNNIFQAGSNDRAVIINTGGDGCNDAGTRCDNRDGNLKISGNLLLDGAKIRSSYVKGAVFTPSSLYRYTAQPATRTLASTIQRDAGPAQ